MNANKLINLLAGSSIYALYVLGVLNDVSEWFLVNVELRQGCVISPWLYNVYMDGVVREVNVNVLGKGLELLSTNGGTFEIDQLLFVDDTAPVANSEEKLCRLVSELVEYAKES